MEKLNTLNLSIRSCFGVQRGNIHFCYLGIPMHHTRINNKHGRIVEKKFERKLNSGKPNT
jgi:hypothetical protein